MGGADHRDPDNAEEARLERARDAAVRFCRHFGCPPERLADLLGPPIRPPLVIEREGRLIEVYRWLGHGRGSTYVQVEIDLRNPGEITVHGALGDRGLGPWKP